MGQRQATYVIVEDRWGTKTIDTIYNQWNYIKLQAAKLERAIKFLKAIPDLNAGHKIFPTFFASHGLSPEVGWVGGYVETGEFSPDGMYADAFQEDNNNGWIILKIRQVEATDRKVGAYSVIFEICCIPGDEDGGDDLHTPDASAEMYFNRERSKNMEFEESARYVTGHTIYNPALKEEAVTMLRALVAGKMAGE